MAEQDYLNKKPLEVSSVNDSGSTQDKAQPILVTGGDDSTTGGGDIVLDWTNISSEADLAVYDQNGDLLPYEIESFDTENEEAVLWVYNSWVRDDTVQALITYGDGPASSEEDVSGTWNNSGQNAVMVQHLQDDPLTATDSTSNNNDGTVNGATATSGEFDGAASFDGTDDEINFDTSPITGSDNRSFVGWVRYDNAGSGAPYNWVMGDIENASNGNVWRMRDADNSIRLEIAGDGYTSSLSTPTSSIGMVGAVLDGSDMGDHILYVDENSEATSGTLAVDTGSGGMAIGHEGDSSGFMEGINDAVRLYSDVKSAEWYQAEYDASPSAGQVYFSQQASESAQDTNLGPTSAAESTASGDTTSISGSTTADTTTATANILGGTIGLLGDGQITVQSGATSTATGRTIGITGISTLDAAAATSTATGTTISVSGSSTLATAAAFAAGRGDLTNIPQFTTLNTTYDEVRDFEPGTITRWSGDTQYLKAQQQNVIQGDYTGKFGRPDTSKSFNITINPQVDTFKSFSFSTEVTAGSAAAGETDNSLDYRYNFYDENGVLMRFYLNAQTEDINLQTESDAGVNSTFIQNYSPNTVYDFEVNKVSDDEIRIFINGDDKGVFALSRSFDEMNDMDITVSSRVVISPI